MDQMGFSWQDIPPTFMGTSSSFGQQPPALMNGSLKYADMNGLNSTGLSENQPATTSADMLAAAILHNGHNGRSQSMHDQAQLFPIPNQSRSMSTSMMMPYSQHHAGPLSVKPDAYPQDALFAEMVFGSSSTSNGRQEQNRAAKPVDLRWGSDAGFGTGQGFIPPIGQATVEALEQNKISSLDCLEPHSSTAASTRPPSPIVTRNPGLQRKQSSIAVEELGSDTAGEEPKPRKRRKNKIKTEEDEDEHEDGQKAPRKRRTKSMAGATAPAARESPPLSKRRKSAVSSGAKPTRENLTEDQKRENHIKSEQKRRTLIKEGFDDLGELVPDLRSGGFSKSAILVMAGDFLEDLIQGNQVLRAMLDKLEQR